MNDQSKQFWKERAAVSHAFERDRPIPFNSHKKRNSPTCSYSFLRLICPLLFTSRRQINKKKRLMKHRKYKLLASKLNTCFAL